MFDRVLNMPLQFPNLVDGINAVFDPATSGVGLVSSI